jgi:hypothetical protein
MSSAQHKRRNGGRRRHANGSGSGKKRLLIYRLWPQVEQEHREIVEKLNAEPVSFTAPSAEGITLYGGIAKHGGSDAIQKLARSGYETLADSIAQEREPPDDHAGGESKQDTEAPPSSAATGDREPLP